jgi:hypothetical protein
MLKAKKQNALPCVYEVNKAFLVHILSQKARTTGFAILFF